MRKAIAALTLCLWALMTGAEAVDYGDLVGEQWYGMYMNGQKVGYSVSEVSLGSDGSVVATEDASFKLNMAGIKQDMRIYYKRVYDADGALQRIDQQVDDIAGSSIFTAVVNGESLVLRSKVGGQEKETHLPRPRESLQDLLKQLELVQGNPQMGSSVEFSVFEPMYQAEIDGKSTLIGVEDRLLDGVLTKLYRIETVLTKMGIRSVAIVTGDGTILEDEIAGGIITIRLEPEEVAKDVQYANDVIVSNAVILPEAIENPRGRLTLELKLVGPLTSEHIFNDERQTLSPQEEFVGFVGTKLPTEGLEGVTLPVTLDHLKKWTEPSLFVQSDHPEMMKKAKEILGNETDALRVSSVLSRWVYDNVRTTFSARLTNSLEVLDHMEGDCTEHSMLFVGLARAAGLPARPVAGLIYVSGPQPGFYFHQWATVWVGKWIDVDPTFDQPIADATHIKLAEGNLFEQTKLLPVIGQLEIEVLETR